MLGGVLSEDLPFRSGQLGKDKKTSTLVDNIKKKCKNANKNVNSTNKKEKIFDYD